MSAGLALPKRIFGHGWVNWQGQRMSKSLGTSVDPLEAADRLGPDPLRLYLVKEIAYGHDGDFTWERFEERYNVDLANNFGNLVNRVAVMAHKYRGGRLAPVPGADPAAGGPCSGRSASIPGRRLDEHQLHAGMAAAFELIDATNEFITRSEPWVLARTPDRRAELDQALFEMAEAVRIAAILLWPVMPASCTEILRRMGQVGPISEIRLDRDTAWAGGDRQIVKGPPLWPRIEDTGPAPGAVAAAGGVDEPKGAAATMTNETEPAAARPPQEGRTGPAAGTVETTTAAALPEEPRLSFNDFMKLQLRVAKVVAAEAIPKSKKLLKVTVDTGSGERTLVAGIARVYPPETLVGRSVVIVANLEKATLMGVESNGMILAATDPDGRPVLLTVDDPAAAPPGSRVR